MEIATIILQRKIHPFANQNPDYGHKYAIPYIVSVPICILWRIFLEDSLSVLSYKTEDIFSEAFHKECRRHEGHTISKSTECNSYLIKPDGVL